MGSCLRIDSSELSSLRRLIRNLDNQGASWLSAQGLCLVKGGYPVGGGVLCLDSLSRGFEGIWGTYRL